MKRTILSGILLCLCTVVLQALPPCKTLEFSDVVCKGQNYYFGNRPLTNAGTYYDTTQTKTKCDSITTLHLSVYTTTLGNISRILCSADSIYFGNSLHKTAGIFYDTTINRYGCDSTTKLILAFKKQQINDSVVHICKGNQFILNSKIYINPGLYNIHIKNGTSCDSIIALHLFVDSVYKFKIYDTLCEGKTYNFYGMSVTKSGLYNKIFKSKNGCDSTVSLYMMFNPTPPKPVISKLGSDTLKGSLTADKYMWHLNGKLQLDLVTFKVKVTKSGDYTLITQYGDCVSLVSDPYTISVITGLGNIIDTESFRIFPNPAQNVLTVMTEKADRFTLSDYSGNKILILNLVVGTNMVNLLEVPNGIYILQTSNGRKLLSIFK